MQIRDFCSSVYLGQNTEKYLPWSDLIYHTTQPSFRINDTRELTYIENNIDSSTTEETSSFEEDFENTFFYDKERVSQQDEESISEPLVQEELSASLLSLEPDVCLEQGMQSVSEAVDHICDMTEERLDDLFLVFHDANHGPMYSADAIHILKTKDQGAWLIYKDLENNSFMFASNVGENQHIKFAPCPLDYSYFLYHIKVFYPENSMVPSPFSLMNLDKERAQSQRLTLVRFKDVQSISLQEANEHERNTLLHPINHGALTEQARFAIVSQLKTGQWFLWYSLKEATLIITHKESDSVVCDYTYRTKEYLHTLDSIIARFSLFNCKLPDSFIESIEYMVPQPCVSSQRTVLFTYQKDTKVIDQQLEYIWLCPNFGLLSESSVQYMLTQQTFSLGKWFLAYSEEDRQTVVFRKNLKGGVDKYLTFDPGTDATYSFEHFLSLFSHQHLLLPVITLAKRNKGELSFSLFYNIMLKA